MANESGAPERLEFLVNVWKWWPAGRLLLQHADGLSNLSSRLQKKVARRSENKKESEEVESIVPQKR